MNFLVKKAISPSNFSRPPPTIAPLPAPSTPASRPLYPRFRTLYPRFRTLYPRTPAPPVHPLIMGLNDSNKHRYLQDINCSYILHACLANLNSTSTTLKDLILYTCICFFKKMRGNVFNTLQHPNAPTARWPTCCKKLVRCHAFRKNIVYKVYKVPLWGSKTLSSSWPNICIFRP